MRRQVPYTGDEKISLHASLNRHRDVVRWKVEGLDEEQLRRPMTPTGTNLIGLVKHLGSIEYGWFCNPFGRTSEWIEYDPANPEADMRARPDESSSDILAYYERACAAADQVIDEVGLEEVGTAWGGTVVSLRWILIHMIEDTARHAGHMDILRELIDGATGAHPD